MKLSIVTLSFQQARFLPQAIDSVKAQSAEVQYVVVDPGSTDGSREIIARNHARFSAVVLGPDSGPADGLNKGFAQCDGDIFGYLNADDRYTPGALDYAAQFFLSHPAVDVLFGAIAIIDGTNRRRWRKRIPDPFNLRRAAEGRAFVYCPSVFFRRAAFQRCGGFRKENHTCWDYELAVDLALAGCTFWSSPYLLGEFRLHPESISGSKRLQAEYVADCRRIEQKIYASGLSRRSRALCMWEQLRFRCNAARHLRNVWGVKPLAGTANEQDSQQNNA